MTAPHFIEQLCLGVDLLHLTFIVDDHTEVENTRIAREMAEVMIEILHNPFKPLLQGENAVYQALQECVKSIPPTFAVLIVIRHSWVRALAVATPSSVKHFLRTFTDYLESNVVQAQHRDNHTFFQSIDEFMIYRREAVGARACLFPCQMHLLIPDEVLFQSIVLEIEYLAVEMMAIDNVVCSFA